jgi:hypothetical protein
MNRLDKGEDVPPDVVKKALETVPAKDKAPLIQSLITRIEPSKKDVLPANPFKNIEKLRRELQPLNQYAFYQQQVKKIKGDITPEKLINTRTPKKNIRFGSMFLYNYDPKWKEELPYYDTYPLVIPFSIAEGGFLGLNLHYLPYYLRFKLLEKLYDFEADESLDDNARLNFEWQMTRAVAGLPEAIPCVKHYLSDHVRSDFLLIPPTEWKAVIMLPLQRFQKAGVGTVWNDSLSKMRR